MKNQRHCPRLYIESATVDAYNFTKITLSTAQKHHIEKVLRLKHGHTICVFNENLGEWTATLDFGTDPQAILTNQIKPPLTTKISLNTLINNQDATIYPHSQPLILACAVTKNFDFITEKATELGAQAIAPLITDFSHQQGRYKPEKFQQKITHATQQCGRLDMPVLLPEMRLTDFITQTSYPILWAWEQATDNYLWQHLQTQNPTIILIGPEGGFSAEEADYLANQSQVQPVTLSNATLKAETAVILALGLASMNITS
jgi:16S rRNA (uracil1498-N3)-methyltransferase